MDSEPVDGQGSGTGGSERYDTIRARLDSEESISDAVIRSAAALSGRSPLDLEPLYDAVDPDALDALFQRSDGNPVDLQVTFTYASCTFLITSEELLVRCEAPQP